MKKNIQILGAGQTSMLASIMLAKRGYVVSILDNKPLKQSHFALLRFGSRAIEEETGIKLEEVEIKKNIYFDGSLHNESNIKFDNLYSQKVTGKIQRRSIGNLGVGKRYIPPVDFFDQLKSRCHELEVETANCDSNNRSPLDLIDGDCRKENSTIISTLPMPKVYNLVHEGEIKFDFEKIYTVEFEIPNCNVHQTIYYPKMDRSTPAYRISVVGSFIKCEISQSSYDDFKQHELSEDGQQIKESSFAFQYLLDNLANQILSSFGIDVGVDVVKDKTNTCLFDGMEKVIKEQKFGKISPINEELRHSIIYNLTRQQGVYSLGRFSCWRSIMLDGVVNDVKRIENLIKLGNLTGYESAKSMAARLST